MNKKVKKFLWEKLSIDIDEPGLAKQWSITNILFKETIILIEQQARKELAEKLLGEGELAQARPHFEKALQKNPDYLDGYCNLGSLCFKTDDFAGAEKYYKLAISKDENLLEIYYNLGLLHMEQKEFDKALCCFKENLTRNSDDCETYINMARCAKALGRNQDALAFLEETIKFHPDNLEAAIDLAGLYIENDQFEKAEDLLRVSLISHPEETALHYVLGLVLISRKKYESALAQFNKVVTLDEDHANGFFQLAECCLALDLFKQAEPFYAKAIKLDPSLKEAVLQLGRLYERRKDSESAVLMFEHWIKLIEPDLNPDDKEAEAEFRKVCAKVASYFRNQGDHELFRLYEKKCG